jgi:hypothetical protein
MNKSRVDQNLNAATISDLEEEGPAGIVLSSQQIQQ